MTEAFICDAIRTPIGRYGGALSGIRADDLAAIPIRALKERNHQVDWAALDDIILGCANQAGEDNRNLARMAGLLADTRLDQRQHQLQRDCRVHGAPALGQHGHAGLHRQRVGGRLGQIGQGQVAKATSQGLQNLSAGKQRHEKPRWVVKS